MRKEGAWTVLTTVAHRWDMVYHGAMTNTSGNPKG